MPKLHSISINCTKIQKERLILGKKGGKWLNLTIEEFDEDDQYGNNLRVSVGQTKDERDRKEKRTFLGNGKTLWTGKPKPAVVQDGGSSVKHTAPAENDPDDVPF